MTAHIEVYRDAASEWRWRFVSNGRIMADSGQGYSRRIDCLDGLAAVLGGCVLDDYWLHRFVWDSAVPDEFAFDPHIQPFREAIPIRDLTRETP